MGPDWRCRERRGANEQNQLLQVLNRSLWSERVSRCLSEVQGVQCGVPGEPGRTSHHSGVTFSVRPAAFGQGSQQQGSVPSQDHQREFAYRSSQRLGEWLMRITSDAWQCVASTLSIRSSHVEEAGSTDAPTSADSRSHLVPTAPTSPKGPKPRSIMPRNTTGKHILQMHFGIS